MNEIQKKEFARKFFHLGTIIIQLSYRYLFGFNKKTFALYFALFTLLVIAVEIARIKHKTFKKIFNDFTGILLRKHEFNDFTGATYLTVSSFFCIVIFPSDIAFLAISFLIIGDTLAALIGIPLGKVKIFGGQKSFEGSLACFWGCFLFALIYVEPIIATVGAAAATTAEVSNLRIDDNIKIPIFSGILMWLIQII